MKILVADDYEDARILQETILGNQGYAVESAANGIEALAMARLSKPDMIISDIMMPELDGFEFCRYVKSDEELKDIPFVFYTATFTDSDDEKLAMDLGASRFIIKPTEPDEFAEIINEVIEEYKQNKLSVRSPQAAEDVLEQRHKENLTNKLIKKMRQLEVERQALRESENRTRILLDSAPVGIGVSDTEGNVIEANRYMLKITGYTLEELRNTNVSKTFVDPFERKALLNELKESGHVRDREVRLKRKDGTVYDALVSTDLVEIDGQKRLLTTKRDITSQKKAERALKESEERYALAMRGTNDGLWNRNLETGEVYYSPRWKKILGYNDDEIPNLREEWEKRIHHDDYNGVMNNLIDHFEDRTKHYVSEYRMKHKDGSYRWILSRGAILRDGYGNPIRIAGSHTDITERKEAREKLKLMSQFSEMNPAPVLRCDSNGTIQMANQAAIDILSMESLEETTIDSILPDMEEDVLEDCILSDKVISRSLAIGERFYDFTIRGSKDMNRAYIYGSDITKRKKAVYERENLEAQLRQAQKMETIGTLAGGIAHDFNNILSPILTCTEIALEDSPKSGDAHESLKHVIQAVGRARDLVRQITTFSRLDKQDHTALKINRIIKEVLKLLRPSLPSTIEIRQNIDPDCGEIIADAVQMHQVIMNLCTNAYQAMREDGGTIEVNGKNIEVDKAYARGHLHLHPGSYVLLSISDTGLGMDSATMERIFDPFFTTKGVEEGTGLGLSVVHGIVMGHGGEITVESKSGSGTTFHIYLPRADSEMMQEIEEKGGNIDPTGTERILFVDDEVPISSAGKSALERLGYRVTTMNDSLEALERFSSEPDKYDLVITDLTMPKMTGIQLASKLTGIRPDIPVILISGYSGAINPENINQFGISEYIVKPFTGKALGGAIRKVIDEGKKGDL